MPFLAAAWIAVGCGGEPALPASVTDSAGPDAPGTNSGEVVALSEVTPARTGPLRCVSNVDCASGWCVEHLGDSVCAEPCVDACFPGFECRPITGGGGDVTFVCLSVVPSLCRPCSTDDDCSTSTSQGSRCLDYGPEGRFCGAPCAAGCPGGFSCETRTVGGVELEQCVADLGSCPCSERSARLALETPCSRSTELGTCTGVRVCTAVGLTECSAPEAAADLCNGVDDDCDGLTDELPCDDGDTCTVDQCGGAQGCVGLPTGTGACDDGDSCTTGDVCGAQGCVGVPVVCDDGDPCTLDTCSEGACTTLPAPGACDDGDPCTVGEVCGALGCGGGQLVNCADDDPCTDDGCAAGLGCQHVSNDTPCFDGDVCTVGDTCSAGGCLAGAPLACDDGNACTLDGCNAATGCSFEPIPACGTVVPPLPVAPLCQPAGVGTLFPLATGAAGGQLLRLHDTAQGQVWLALNMGSRYQLLTGHGCKVGAEHQAQHFGFGHDNGQGVALPGGGFASDQPDGVLRGYDRFGFVTWVDDQPDDHGSAGDYLTASGPDTVQGWDHRVFAAKDGSSLHRPGNSQQKQEYRDPNGAVLWSGQGGGAGGYGYMAIGGGLLLEAQSTVAPWYYNEIAGYLQVRSWLIGPAGVFGPTHHLLASGPVSGNSPNSSAISTALDAGGAISVVNLLVNEVIMSHRLVRWSSTGAVTEPAVSFLLTFTAGTNYRVADVAPTGGGKALVIFVRESTADLAGMLIGESCLANSDCDDSQPCTSDSCTALGCDHYWIPGCGAP